MLYWAVSGGCDPAGYDGAVKHPPSSNDPTDVEAVGSGLEDWADPHVPAGAVHAARFNRRQSTATSWLVVAFGLLLAGVTSLTFAGWQKAASPWFWIGLVLSLGGLGVAVWTWPPLNRAQRSLALAMTGSHDGMFEWDPVTKRLQVGKRLLDMLGYAENTFPTSDDWLNITHPDDRQLFNAAVVAHLRGQSDHFYCEYRVQAQSGKWVWLAARGLVERPESGPARLMAGSVSDITDRKEREQRMQWLARTDALTQLPNRHSLLERFPSVLSQARRQGQQVGVLFVDVDRFKDVNDTMGHGAGDAVLRELTRRLPSALRDYDLAARQGGDEFILLLPGLSTLSEAEQVAQRVLDGVAAPVDIQGRRIVLSASIGIALYPDHGLDPDTLLRRADLAMYAAKGLGGHRQVCYTADLEHRVAERVSLEQKLRGALESHALTLAYQPQFDAQTGQLVGAEALARWTSDGQAVPPDVFIRVAEASGMIANMGQQLFELAMKQLTAWEPKLPEAFRLALNVSVHELRIAGLDARWLEMARNAGVSPGRLALEVTESALLSNDPHALTALDNLRRAGVELALDDFGTGYASLSYLRVLAVDVIKIDRSFVSSVGHSGLGEMQQRDQAVVRAMLEMAHALSCQVVAEGVETPEQASWLKTQGCDVLQGYGLGRPISAPEFEAVYLSQ